jgi:hypothetical protein
VKGHVHQLPLPLPLPLPPSVPVPLLSRFASPSALHDDAVVHMCAAISHVSPFGHAFGLSQAIVHSSKLGL